MLGDLESNVIAAVILVMIVTVAALGLRNALLVGLAIPGAFLGGVAALWMMGYTMNVVVLFALILVVGMLVDGGHRHHGTGLIASCNRGSRRARPIRAAAKRMAWPIIASTATTLSVFVPLLFWGGVVGEFMKYLPITVLLTLTASLAMALIFIPVAGGLIGAPARAERPGCGQAQLRARGDRGDPARNAGISRDITSAPLLERAIRRPGLTLLLAMALFAGFFRRLRQARRRRLLLSRNRAGFRPRCRCAPPRRPSRCMNAMRWCDGWKERLIRHGGRSTASLRARLPIRARIRN